MRVILTYHFRGGGGGVLIDPDGPESAVRDLLERYGARLDLDELGNALSGDALSILERYRQSANQQI